MFVSCWFSTIKLQNNGEITNFLGNLLIPNWHYWREHPVLWASRWALVHWQQHPRRGLWRSGIVWGSWTAAWSWRGNSPRHCCACRTSRNSAHVRRWAVLSSVRLSRPSLRRLWDSHPRSLSPKGLLDLWFFRPSYNVFNDTNSGVWAKVNQRNCAC